MTEYDNRTIHAVHMKSKLVLNGATNVQRKIKLELNTVYKIAHSVKLNTVYKVTHCV